MYSKYPATFFSQQSSLRILATALQYIQLNCSTVAAVWISGACVCVYVCVW